MWGRPEMVKIRRETKAGTDSPEIGPISAGVLYVAG